MNKASFSCSCMLPNWIAKRFESSHKATDGHNTTKSCFTMPYTSILVASKTGDNTIYTLVALYTCKQDSIVISDNQTYTQALHELEVIETASIVVDTVVVQCNSCTRLLMHGFFSRSVYSV